MNQQEASAAISEKVAQAYALIHEAEAIANAYNLDFRFSVTYGMGGTYDGEEGEWYASSQSC